MMLLQLVNRENDFKGRQVAVRKFDRAEGNRRVAGSTQNDSGVRKQPLRRQRVGRFLLLSPRPPWSPGP